MSGLEAVSNVVVGFGFAICVQVAAFPVFGLHPSPGQHLGLAVVFTIASLARSYALWRVFDRIGRA
jgi:hypothetical protein